MATDFTNMSPKGAEERADQIITLLASDEDPETAHGDQERLCADVLRAIVVSKPDPWVRMLAEQALRVIDAPGERW